MMEVDDEIFGVDYASTGGVTASGDMELVEGVVNARQSIYNQLLTEKGTYPTIDEEYGSEIYEALGEDFESATVEALQIYVQNALYENPRVRDINRIDPYRTVNGELHLILSIVLVNGTEDTLNLNINEITGDVGEE